MATTLRGFAVVWKNRPVTPYGSLFVPESLLAITSDEAFVAAMVEAEVALARAQGWDLVVPGPLDASESMREGRRVAEEVGQGPLLGDEQEILEGLGVALK